jgi:hypothetical protein
MAARAGSLFASFADWRARRALRARADAYVAHLNAEPDAQDVQWLATNATGGDTDHAAWELRYARRALGLLTAQRDALDDRTASVVARALAASLARDPHVGAGKLRVAERQLNARLAAYGEAMIDRSGAGTGWHIGRALLRFAGRSDAAGGELVARAAAILTGYLSDANTALREQFGAAALPDDIAPSAFVGDRRP